MKIEEAIKLLKELRNECQWLSKTEDDNNIYLQNLAPLGLAIDALQEKINCAEDKKDEKNCQN